MTVNKHSVICKKKKDAFYFVVHSPKYSTPNKTIQYVQKKKSSLVKLYYLKVKSSFLSFLDIHVQLVSLIDFC